MNKKVLALLSIIVLTSGILGSLMLTRGHDWGDDFAAYIMQAQSIVTGRMNEFIQRSTLAVEASSGRFGPVTAPWGFPLLLAPVYALFGLRMLALKLVLTLCYMAFLIAFFCLARTMLTDAESLLLTGVMAFNTNMLEAQNEVLSDLPFLLLSTVGLWLIERYRHRNPDSPGMAGSGVVIGLVAFMAAFTRPNGFLLLLALATAQLMAVGQHVVNKGGKSRAVLCAAIPYLVFAVFFAGQALIFPNSGGGLREQFSTLSLQTVWRNLGYYFWLPSDFFAHIMSGGKIVYMALLIFFVVGVADPRKQNLPILLYGLATIGLYVGFPLIQGLRYLYPILPIFVIFAFRGMKVVAGLPPPRYQGAARTFVYIVWAGLVVVSVRASLADAEANMAAGRQIAGGWQAGPFSSASASMFAFIRQTTPVDSMVIFFKPRAMRLLANRDSFTTPNCGDVPKGDYVVLVNDNGLSGQIPPEEITHCNPALQLAPVFHQQSFIVYQIFHGP